MLPESIPSEVYQLFFKDLDFSDCLICSQVSREFWHLSRQITFREIDFKDNILSPAKLTRVQATLELLEDTKYSILPFIETTSLVFKFSRRTAVNPIGSKIIHLLCSAPKLQNLTISVQSGVKRGWHRLPSDMQTSLRNLIRSSYLRSLSVCRFSKIPNEVFDGTNFESLTMQSATLNAPSPAIIELQQLKELISDSLDQVLPVLMASTQSLEVLHMTLNEAPGSNQNFIDFSHFRNLRKVKIRYNGPYPFETNAEIVLSYLPSLCKTYLYPSSDCQSLKELAVTIPIFNAEAVFSEITTETSRCLHSLDAAMAQPAFSNANIRLDLVRHLRSMWMRELPTELSKDTQAQILGQFPALCDLDRAAVVLDVRIRVRPRPADRVNLGSYNVGFGNGIAQVNAGLPPPAGQDMPPSLGAESDGDLPGLMSADYSPSDSDWDSDD